MDRSTYRLETDELGDFLQEFVNRVSHRQGHTLAVLGQARVTLPQVLLLRRLATDAETSPSDLASRAHMSFPAASQMIDRLAALGFVARRESPDDRRRKLISVTNKGRALLERIRQARAREYSLGLSQLPHVLQAELLGFLRAALKHLPDESGAAPAPADARRSRPKP